MSFRRKPVIPATPRVISPSPTPSDQGSSQTEGYFGPVTRSAKRKGLATPQPTTVAEENDESAKEDEGIHTSSSEEELRRARTRSRSPLTTRKLNGLSRTSTGISSTITASQPLQTPATERTHKAPEINGHLAPASPQKGGWSWRDLSRSPSPLGLIPIHRHWRTFVHKHEVPRKLLHVSIGFFVIWLYTSGAQTSRIWPYLLGALIPIATLDYIRHVNPSFNRLYVKIVGAFMRESEFNGWNGVIFYLLGAWAVLYFFPKDVAVMGVMLLSWCDTAASTFGRLYGRYTPRIRRGKSLAGSIAAFLMGVITAWGFWGVLVPLVGPMPGDDDFMFKGTLKLPYRLTQAVGMDEAHATLEGVPALVVMSVVSGLVASASEVVDIFGLDDNLTIPVLSGLGIWSFLKVFGQ